MNNELTFEKFEKIGRLNRSCTITEKIDGTNAQICFNAEGDMLVGSRKRQIWPAGYEGRIIDRRVSLPSNSCDNAGFAAWAYSNRDELFEFLGKGRHFGEWCGGKIQRGYGIPDKAFLLFNVNRFGPFRQEIPQSLMEIGLGTVPVLYQGPFSSNVIDDVMSDLAVRGSAFVDGYMNPEGVVVYHHAIKKMFKVTYEHDGIGKGQNRQTDDVSEGNK